MIEYYLFSASQFFYFEKIFLMHFDVLGVHFFFHDHVIELFLGNLSPSSGTLTERNILNS